MTIEEIYRSEYDSKFKLQLFTYENIKFAFKLLVKLLTYDKKFETEEDIALHKINITAVFNFIVNNIMTLIGGVKIPKENDEKIKDEQKINNNHKISFYNELMFKKRVKKFYKKHPDNMKEFTNLRNQRTAHIDIDYKLGEKPEFDTIEMCIEFIGQLIEDKKKSTT